MTRSSRPAPLLRLALLALVVCGTGPSCRCVLPSNPSLPEVLHVVNRNASAVQSLFTTDVDISGSAQGQFFMLDARLAVEKPRRFRLIARSPLGGEELDLGSNDRQFWFWVARAQPPALYFSDHGQSTAGAIPFDPNWLVEALGIGEVDATAVYEGPVTTGGGRLEIRSQATSPQGESVTKVTQIDACRGWIVEQTLIDSGGRVVAQAALSNHWVDRTTDVVIPRRIRLSWPDADLSLTLNLHDVGVNEVPVGTDLWERPRKAEEIDLGTTRITPFRTASLRPAPADYQRPSRGILPAGLFRRKRR